MDMEHLGLADDQKEKLKQFTEITNVQDYEVAVCTLASLDWNVEQAIEAHLMQDVDNPQDDPEIIEEAMVSNDSPVVVPAAERTIPTSSNARRRNRAEDEVNYQVKRLRIDDRSNNEPSARVTRSGNVFGVSSRSNHAPPAQNGQSSSSAAAAAPRRRPPTNANDVVFLDSDDDDDMRVDMDDGANDPDPFPIRRENSSVPLIPEDPACDEDALRNFGAVFEARYCSGSGNSAYMPPFQTVPLKNALREGFDQKNAEARRPVVMYIHNDRSIASNIFASQVLCTEAVSTLLRCQYVVWPWDVTYESNLIKILEQLQVLNLGDLRQFLQRNAMGKVEAFPMMAILIKERGSYRLVECARGTDTIDQVMAKLMHGVEEYQQIRMNEVNEQREREERTAIRAQQEKEYEASLTADRARIEAKNRAAEEAKQEEIRRRRAEEEEINRRQMVAATLPTEPAATETDIVHVKFRFPAGGQGMRRFRKNESIETLVNYLSSEGYSPDKYKYFNSDFPKKEVTAHFDLKTSFVEAKWPGREQIFVDEI